MSEELDARLKAALVKRDRLTTDAARISGRKEAADRTLQEVEAEIRSKKLDPDTLDETLLKLETAYLQEVTTLEAAVEQARLELNPYMDITR